jgi:hypothetical protein
MFIDHFADDREALIGTKGKGHGGNLDKRCIVGRCRKKQQAAERVVFSVTFPFYKYRGSNER